LFERSIASSRTLKYINPRLSPFSTYFLFGKHHFLQDQAWTFFKSSSIIQLVSQPTKYITHSHFNHTHPTTTIQNGHDRSHHKATGPLYQVLYPESSSNEAAPVPWCPSSSPHSSSPPSRRSARRPLRRNRLWLRRRGRSSCRPK
jgi:hypothetical protein